MELAPAEHEATSDLAGEDPGAPRPARTSGRAPIPRVRIPQAPGPGLVPVLFDGDPARRLVVTRMVASARATGRASLSFQTVEVHAVSHALLCVAPCATWLQPGAYRFGVGGSEDPRWTTSVLQIDGPSTVAIGYLDRLLLRIVGGALIAAGLCGAVPTLLDLADGGDIVPPVVAAVASGLALVVGIGLAAAGDGIDLRFSPTIAGYD